MSLPAIDKEECVRLLLELLTIPSPSGHTEEAVGFVEKVLGDLGVEARRTPKGALVWTLAGGDGPVRSVAAHIDTLGAMVREVKGNGRLRLTPIGGFDWATIEGAECVVHTFAGERISGTVVNTKQSVHVHGPELRDLKRDEGHIEVRLDVTARTADAVRGLGIGVGDFVSFVSGARRTETGFIKGRHLDDKAAVAVVLAVTRALVEAAAALPGTVHFFLSNYEEVGHGAAAGIPPETKELLCVDMAAVGQGQQSDEYSATLCVKDSGGPYDPVMGRLLRSLAKREGIDLKVDVYPYYNSDATAAWRAGATHRAALVGPGVDASHSYERTHELALENTARLLVSYLLEPG